MVELRQPLLLACRIALLVEPLGQHGGDLVVPRNTVGANLAECSVYATLVELFGAPLILCVVRAKLALCRVLGEHQAVAERGVILTRLHIFAAARASIQPRSVAGASAVLEGPAPEGAKLVPNGVSEDGIRLRHDARLGAAFGAL